MGLYLIAFSWLELQSWFLIFQVAVGLGMVIFVHELGHFAVAKMCGVKCEKFYLGFDIYGLKLCKFRWGETEYGIGILPLGGYVKMLGQEDNPARLRAEIERAKQQQADGAGGEDAAAENAGSTETGQAAEANRAEKREVDSKSDAVDVAAAEAALYDPRSYLAQSVPKRMAIISAGVIMNVIFAFIFAVVAYAMGVDSIRCGVGNVYSGTGAWRAGLRPGDTILEMAGNKVERFRDLRTNVSVGDDIEQGIPTLVKRPGIDEPLELTIIPDQKLLIPTIGISNPSTTTLYQDKDEPPYLPGSAASRTEPKFLAGDQIIAVDGQPIKTYAQYVAQLAAKPDQPLTIKLQRASPQGADSLLTIDKRPPVTIELPPEPMRRLGMVMEMGKITAIQHDSPAAEADLRKGDKILKVDGEDPGDPMTLPDRLRRRAGQTITLTIDRDGKPQDVDVTLRQADWFEMPGMLQGNPVSIPELGVAYTVLNEVRSVNADSPADKAGVKKGDVVVEAILLPADEESVKKFDLDDDEIEVKFTDKQPNWPSLLYIIQMTYPGRQVKLTLKDREEPLTMTPVAVNDWFFPERGLRFEPDTFVQRAHSLGEAMKLGGRETLESLGMVFKFLQKIGTQISPRALGGPGTIAMAAGQSASRGFPHLLVFLCMLSANLAVINFLPIPLLDGGHMVLLAWEGIRGKPADERIQAVLTYLGLIFILGLMLWVIGLDIGLISRDVGP